uniref:Thiamin biosynthesis protein S n=1 Tax=Liagoropsis maxima TaxID=1653392 RepID=A0A1G4NW35_9FLOR|nr:Thiamin biosynthesis protein S [Liagoropsis maxima]SCW22870.1 Thiamin biosynthesis protein S [Liagoropsis maxima]
MSEKYCSIQINGEPFHCYKQMSIQALLTYLNIDIEINLIEYNNEILYQHQLKSIMLKEEDKLEIITVVGGG